MENLDVGVGEIMGKQWVSSGMDISIYYPMCKVTFISSFTLKYRPQPPSHIWISARVGIYRISRTTYATLFHYISTQFLILDYFSPHRYNIVRSTNHPLVLQMLVNVRIRLVFWGIYSVWIQ